MKLGKISRKLLIDLNPKFGVAYAQKCYADYHYGLIRRDMEVIAEAMADFEKAIEKFPDCPDCYILYAQVLIFKVSACIK